MQSTSDHIYYDEDILLKKLGEGDRAAYHFLFDTYYKILCLYATGLIKDRASAEDIVQTAFVNLWIKREHLHIRSSIKSYLYKSVYNIFVNEYKKWQREESVLDQIHYEEVQRSVEVEEDHLKKRIEWVNKEIDLLPPRSREIFVMNKKRGLSYKEIATLLDLSENTIESHIGRALKRIRQKVPLSFLFLLFGPVN